MITLPNGKQIRLLAECPSPSPAEPMTKLTTKIPSSYTLCPRATPIIDQLSIGSCTSTSLCDTVFFMARSRPMPSRLFNYYLSRAKEGYITDDVGCDMRTAMSVGIDRGFCPETKWTYVDDGKKFKTKPTEACYTLAKNQKILDKSYLPGDGGEAYRRTLFTNKAPIIVGITIWESMLSLENLKSGFIPIPEPGEKYLGFHYLQLYGYDDAIRTFTLKNSWGTYYGDRGWFHCSYDYLVGHHGNFEAWTIKSLA